MDRGPVDQKMTLEQTPTGDFEPFASAEEAQKAIRDFAKAFEQLRDDHKMHHVVCMIAVDVAQEGGGAVAAGSVAFSNDPHQLNRLAADGFRRYALPAIQWGEALKKMADPSVGPSEINAIMGGTNRQ